MKKLNLGCGTDIRKGYLNVDKIRIEGADLIHNLNEFPYPFHDEEFNEIICISVLEHLDNIPKVMKELHRLLKPEGILKIKVPHFTSTTAYDDPTHKHFFTWSTFDYFTANNDYEFYFNFKYGSVNKRIVFAKKRAFWNYLIEFLANSFPRVYENTFLRVFPALSLYIEIKK